MKRTLNIADLLCGAGGTSTGAILAARAAGYDVRVQGVNHWTVAVATHHLNHPEQPAPLCTNIDDVDPFSLYKRGELDILFASPECTHHSNARGGKPMDDQSRCTAWCVTKWAEKLMPAVIFVENVKEFKNWGPLDEDCRPIKELKGATFDAWINVFRSLGYKTDHRVLCCADYGAPTTRERLIVQCVRGAEKIQWPAREYAPAKEGKLKPWIPAREIIDWDLKGRWLDEMPGKKQYGGLPLSPKTLARIHAGLHRFGLKGFIVPPQTGKNRVRSLDKPLATVTTESRGVGFVEPFIVEHRGTHESQVKSSAMPVDACLSTISTSGAHHSLVMPFLVPQFGERDGQIPRAHSLDAPLPVVTSHGAGAIVEPFVIPIDHHGSNGIGAYEIDRPLTTITTEARHGLVEPFMVPVAHGGGESRACSIDAPAPTICGNRGDLALIESQAFLVKYNRTGNASSVNEPMPTVTTKDRLALVNPVVEINGDRYVVRLRWRMLQPHELAAGQSFPSDYKFTGNKSEQVKQIGNAVPPALAFALLSCRLKAA